jgi:hypothetical protein
VDIMSAPTEFRWRPRRTTLYGIPVIVQEFDIPDSAPPDLKEALARRTLVTNGGRCPCGAKAQPPNRAARRRAARRGDNIATEVWHRPECPASFHGYLVCDIGPEAAS